jgi:cell division septation protein DedD
MIGVENMSEKSIVLAIWSNIAVLGLALVLGLTLFMPWSQPAPSSTDFLAQQPSSQDPLDIIDAPPVTSPDDLAPPAPSTEPLLPAPDNVVITPEPQIDTMPEKIPTETLPLASSPPVVPAKTVVPTKKPQNTTTSPVKPTSTPSVATKSIEKSVPSTKPASSSTKPVPVTKKKTLYFVQLASYTSLVRAQGSKQTLQQKGLVTQIDVADLPSKATVYRLKMGPWSNKDEADQILKNMKTQEAYKDAFITSQTVTYTS